MRAMLAVPLCIALTVLSWGVWGPVLHTGQEAMGGDRWRPFICVGLAYFFIAVVVPLAMLMTRGENGGWTVKGTFWSLAAGVAGALGSLGIILAFENRGDPVFVMPLVFGCAPVVNTLITMFLSGTFRDVKPIFLAAIAVVVTGAVLVLVFKPSSPQSAGAVEYDFDYEDGKVTATFTPQGKTVSETVGPATEEQLRKDRLDVYRAWMKEKPYTAAELLLVALSIGMTAICWGGYGPVLHTGQMKMKGSRLRPFMCVGMAYFAVAVVVPLVLLGSAADEIWNTKGTLWSLGGGTAGALGALGIIYAFNFGGKPIYVMPVVFGGAPVVNTFYSILAKGAEDVRPVFFVALVLVAVGAVTVLVFAPKPGKGRANSTSHEGAAPQPAKASSSS